MTDESFTPEQAILVARAAGLDLDRPLAEQVEAEGPPAGPPTPEKVLADHLNAAQSQWFSVGGGTDAA